MKYEKVIFGIFVKRVNRFIAEVLVNNSPELAHIKNTGRLKELLIPGRQVALEICDRRIRKTKYSLIAVQTNNSWVNIDSQAVNTVVYEGIKLGMVHELNGVHTVQRECVYGDSRFDLFFADEIQQGFMEVKGVTLSEHGVALFPDAPSSRASKHLHSLIQATKNGYRGIILFCIQREKCHLFRPHKNMDPIFYEMLIEAYQHGVEIIAYECLVKADEFELYLPIPVDLS